MPPRKSFKKKSFKKKAYRRRGKINSVAQLSKDNYAKLSDTIVLSGGNMVTDVVENFNWNLSMFPRAVSVAENYQEFKLDYIECRIKPYYDTFQTPAAAVLGPYLTKAPNLYVQIMKDGDTASNLEEFQHSGINPITMTQDKNFTYRLKPAIRMGQVAANIVAGGFTTIKVSPWLNTNDTASALYVPNSASHYGITMYADSREAVATQVAYADIEFEAHFLFRKPQYASTSPSSTTKVNGVIVHPSV